MAAEGVLDGGFVIVVDFRDRDSVGECGGAVVARENSDIVLACSEERFEEV